MWLLREQRQVTVARTVEKVNPWAGWLLGERPDYDKTITSWMTVLGLVGESVEYHIRLAELPSASHGIRFWRSNEQIRDSQMYVVSLYWGHKESAHTRNCYWLLKLNHRILSTDTVSTHCLVNGNALIGICILLYVGVIIMIHHRKLGLFVRGYEILACKRIWNNYIYALNWR